MKNGLTVQTGLRIYSTICAAICAADRAKKRRLRVSAPSRSDLEWADTVTVKVSELLQNGIFYLTALLVCMLGMTACGDRQEPGLSAGPEKSGEEAQGDVTPEDGESRGEVSQETGNGQGDALPEEEDGRNEVSQEAEDGQGQNLQEQGTGQGQEQSGPEQEGKTGGEISTADGKFSIRFEEAKQTYEAEDGTVLLVAQTSFPVVTLSGYEQAAEAINRYVRGTEAFDEESLAGPPVEEMRQWAEEDYKNRGKDNWYQEYMLYEGYGLERMDESVVSFSLETFSYTGGAHPNTLLTGLVFDTQTGERLTLADVTENEDAAYAAVLQFLLEETGKEEYQGAFFDGYEEMLGDLLREDTWYLGEDGFHIIANTYAIAPYVAGSFDFVIPYEQADFLKERFLKEGMDD